MNGLYFYISGSFSCFIEDPSPKVILFESLLMLTLNSKMFEGCLLSRDKELLAVSGYISNALIVSSSVVFV